MLSASRSRSRDTERARSGGFETLMSRARWRPVAEQRRIDRYTVRGVLGRGGTSNVYSAWDPRLHRDVAIKVVHWDVSDDAKTRERFHREVHAIATLRHPSIVDIYDYSGPESQTLYLVMEMVQGRDLHDMVSEHGPVPESVAAAVGHEVCWALQVAHEAGVIHRDVKPENVLLDSRGRIVLTDFGGVKAFDPGDSGLASISRTDIVGTAGFMPPEQQASGALGPYTDVFGLGVLLYNVATAKMPSAGPVLGAPGPAGRYIEPHKYRPDLSDGFCGVLERCLQVKPSRRFPSAETARQSLREILSASGVQDARDELCQYVARPAKHAKVARERAITVHLEALTKALANEDEPRAVEVLASLQVLDPGNKQAQKLGAGLDPAAVRAAGRRGGAAPKRAVQRRGRRWMWRLSVLAVAAVLSALSVLFVRGCLTWLPLLL